MNDLGTSQPQAPAAPVAPEVQEAYQAFRRLAVFDGIPNEALWGCVAQGRVIRQHLERDRFVADAETVGRSGPRIYFVVEGQVAVAVFDPGLLAARRADQQRYEQMTEEERKELSLLRPPPLAREAKKNLATFMQGDLFNSAALQQTLQQGGQRPGAVADQVAFYTVAPATVASIDHAAIAQLAVSFPFFEQRLRRAVEISRDRLRNIAGVKQEILDFFIRHGISVAGEMVRVRQLDSCIDCKLCELACQERYGAKRLTLGGYQIGMLDFVFTCRTCTDQRCLDPCEYDSIKFDPEIREVVINETSCVGCTLCAQACPYDAIEMVDVEDPQNPTYQPGFVKRLSRDNALNFGSGTPRVARPRRIANKCDHCMNYAEQACVSACPTGSLIEISAADLFRERSPAAEALARAGYDQDIKLNHREILPPDPFTKGVGVRDAGMAKVKRGRLGPVLMWGLALAVWFLALAEIVLRIYKPTSSLQYVMLRQQWEPVIARLKVGFRAGTDLAVWCGFLGAALLLISSVYPIMRRFKAFRRMASNTMWFDFHMMAGTMGPMFILLHSAIKLDNVWAVPFWCMWFTVLSGIVGRYLYTQVPDLLNGRELEELDHHRRFGRYRQEYPQAVSVAEATLRRHRENATRIAERAGIIRSFLWLVLEDLRRPGRWARRRREIRRTGAPRKVWKDLAARGGRLMLFERRRVLVPRARLLLHSWKKVHVLFTIFLVAGAVWHIVATWELGISTLPLSW